MPTSSAGLQACLSALILLTVSTSAVQAQTAGPEPLQGGVSQNSMGGGSGASSSATNSAAGAPVFRIQNFIGDARYHDLNYHLHNYSHEQWDTYRKRLHQASAQTVGMQPTQQSPTASTNTNSAGNLMTGFNTAAAAGSMLANSAGGNNLSGAASMPDSNVSTNVSGQVVPGLDY